MKKKPGFKEETESNYRYLLHRYHLLSDLMDSIPDVIYFKDRKGKMVMVNRAHAKGLGLRPEQVIGKTDFDFFPKERAELMAKDDEYVMKAGKPIIDKVERATRADGIDNYVSTTKIPRFDKKGKVVGLVGITRDITRRMQLERDREDKAILEKRLEALEEINRLKSEFVSVVSHELRTPLAIIKEAVLLVLDEIAGKINKKQKDLLCKSKENIEHLKKLIEDLLDFSRIESQKFRLQYSLVNLNDLLKSSADFFKRQAQEKGVKLEYKLPAKDANIFCDAERISQVASNLINNAIKFTEEGGRVEIELKALESKVRVCVKDTGIGIAEQDLPKLFHRFVQVSKRQDIAKKGLGLGLSIVRELIEKHGGEVWVESKLGLGSKFYFTLPRFYTPRVLDKHVKDRINWLLKRDVPVYLIDLVVVNYKEFKKRVSVDTGKLFKDFRLIIEGVLKELTAQNTEKPHLFMSGSMHGELTILLPQANEKAATRVCAELKKRINEYLLKTKAEDVFIALGVLSYSEKVEVSTARGLPATLNIKEIYIGSEKRKFKRINYRTSIDIFQASKVKAAQTVDLSEGGLCFTTDSPLDTDSIININLWIPEIKNTLKLKGRIAWIRKIEDLLGKGEIYKVGLEFTDIKKKDAKIVSGFIKGYLNKQ